MKSNTTTKHRQFIDWAMALKFLYPDDSVKAWINVDNYSNLFLEDWNELMELVDSITDRMVKEGLAEQAYSELLLKLTSRNREIVYNAAIEVLKKYY